MTTILDDFNNRKILDIISYKSGVEFVRNFIILDDNATDLGFNTANFTFPNTTMNIAVLVLDEVEGIIGVTTQQEIVGFFDDSEVLRDFGVTARLIDNYTIQGTEYAQVVRFETDGQVDFRSVSLVLIDSTTVNENYGTTLEYTEQRGSPTNSITYTTLMPQGDSQITVAQDAISILKYGKKIYRLTNLGLLENTEEKQEALDNKLAELKDPKARMILDIPFDVGQLTLLNEIEVQLSYRNVDQFRGFKEGGYYKAWEDAGDYRTKTFYIVGISHQVNTCKTRLKLLEKES